MFVDDLPPKIPTRNHQAELTITNPQPRSVGSSPPSRVDEKKKKNLVFQSGPLAQHTAVAVRTDAACLGKPDVTIGAKLYQKRLKKT